MIESSRVFNNIARSVSTSVGFSIGIPKALELSITTEVTNAIDETSEVEGKKEYHDEKKITYQDGFLQILRYVKKTITIGKKKAVIETEEHVDTVPDHTHENNEQLLERARVYIEGEYGHKQYNETAKIKGKYGNIYEIVGCFKTN